MYLQGLWFIGQIVEIQCQLCGIVVGEEVWGVQFGDDWGGYYYFIFVVVEVICCLCLGYYLQFVVKIVNG